MPPLPPMKHNALLTFTSLLSIVLMTLHVTDDIVRGLSPPGADNAFGVVIFVVWVVGTLVLAERRSGHAIMLLGGLLGLAVPFLHMRGTGVGVAGPIARSDGALFFVWTLVALGVTGLLSAVLAARGLWSLRRGRPGPAG